ncbi:MAG TPA: cytochrome c peroxidase [Opitutaceae bacterium]|nr:cytochrome c peroxidase [Opitutaceae bacterium]
MKPKRRLVRWLAGAVFVVSLGVAMAAAMTDDLAAVRLGERLFGDARFSQPAEVGRGAAVSCQTCHFSDRAEGPRAFCDFAARSPVLARDDGRRTTPRNSPTLLDALEGAGGNNLLHFDGAFATAEELVRETFVGRNFGWLPTEREEARRHFAHVIREDDGGSGGAKRRDSYASLLRGIDLQGPGRAQLAASFRIDVAHATDDEILAACARLVVAYLKTLRFSRDAEGRHDGSAYDRFLEENRLARAPRLGETPREYARRLGEQLAAMRAPRFVSASTTGDERAVATAERFGELELRGARIFFRSAIGAAQASGAGNCVECHVPPHFTDFGFHNTGAAQDEYDARHGAGAFARLEIPGVAERMEDHARWLPPTWKHPVAKGVFLPVDDSAAGEGTDLGLWNVCANPDFPAPQAALERLLNPGDRLLPDEVLGSSIARFKTSTLRGLGFSAPYLHTGRVATIEDVVRFYQRMSALAHEGKLRNAPPEFFAMRLGEDDVAPLAAFLRALDESSWLRAPAP